MNGINRLINGIMRLGGPGPPPGGGCVCVWGGGVHLRKWSVQQFTFTGVVTLIGLLTQSFARTMICICSNFGSSIYENVLLDDSDQKKKRQELRTIDHCCVWER